MNVETQNQEQGQGRHLPAPGRQAEQGLISPYSSIQAFEAAQRMAQSLAASTMVPTEYRDNVANCLVSMELANRIGASVLAVMQNSDIINGRPTWRATFVIAAINTCGKYEPLRFRLDGEGDDHGCVVWTKDREGILVEGPRVSIGMARAEGWLSRKGSKWQTMPEVMLRYRAATFFGRLYAPQVLMGMQTTDEALDVLETTRTPNGTYEVQGGVQELKSALKNGETSPEEAPVQEEEGQITDEQRRRLFALIKEHDVEPEALRRYMKMVHGIESTSKITAAAYEEICQWMETVNAHDPATDPGPDAA